MGQVTPWRYSSTGNESTERATGRSLLVSLPHSGSPLRSSSNASNSSSIFTRVVAVRNEFLPHVYVHTIPRDHRQNQVVDETSCHLGRFYDWMCESSGKEVVRKVDGRGGGGTVSSRLQGIGECFLPCWGLSLIGNV